MAGPGRAPQEDAGQKAPGLVTNPVDGNIPYVNADKLARNLSARQVQMIAIGGTIGTGLFLGTGKALATGGPASMLIAYAICGGIVFVTMLSLGEMASFIPVAGSFCTFAGRFVDDALGFALTWNYWFNDAVSTASDVIALQLLLQYWTDNFPGWAISLIFLVVVIGLNMFSVKVYGELLILDTLQIEYWLSLLKVVTIIVIFIIPEKEYADKISGGTESIAVTAGETKDPAKNMPKVVRNVFWRIILFYIVSIIIIGLNVPYNYPGLSNGDTATSPFTLVFQQAGSAVAGSFINAVLMTSVISAANHALFAGSRLLYTLAVDGYAPRFFGHLNRFQIPWVAVLATSVISGLCFGASYIGAGQLWSWLQKAAIRHQGLEHLLPYKNWTYPVGPIIAIGLNSVLILVQGWKCFSPHFKGVDFVSYYIEIPVMIVMFLAWKLFKRTRFVHRGEMDLITDRYNLIHSTGVDVNDPNEGSPNIHDDNAPDGSRKKKFFSWDPEDKSVLGRIKQVGMWLFL
ncbi:hypothetical protein APSETT445_007286 [Aspergillus pseudonomiae]